MQVTLSLHTDARGEWTAEAFDMPLADARKFVAEFEVAPDIAEVEDECRSRQRRDRPRHLVWLSR